MTLRRLLGLARGHRLSLLLLAALTLLESALLLCLPWLGGQLAGGVLDGLAEAPLGTLAALLLAALALAAGLRAALGLLAARTGLRILQALRARVHDHLQHLPLAFHQRHSRGSLLALTTHETDRLGHLLTEVLVGLPAQLLTAAGAVLLMARIDPALALAVPAAVPAFYLALQMLGRHLRRLAQAAQEAEAQVVAAAAEDLAMLPATKAFTREEAAARRYAARLDDARLTATREAGVYALLIPSTAFLAGAGAVLLLAFAAPGLRTGATTPAEAVSLLLYAALLTRPVEQLAQVYGRIQSARGTLARLGAILDTPAEPGRDRHRSPFRAQGAIGFEDVRFAYDDREPALDGVTLSIRPGETVALTGPNGAGKSTVAALLLRYMDPQAGVVRLDGTDLRDLHVEDLRRQIGLVPQSPLLFDGSIRDNIAWGREDATEAEIRGAARIAQAEAFVAALPDGYDTRIGEGGVRLSGGQAQRVALARALLKEPPILILDEATSMYDLDAEGAFVAAARAGLRGRTVLLITHRPATLALADRVVAIEGGRVVAVRDRAA